MSIVLGAVVVFIIVAIVHNARISFIENVKSGDIVGVKFGDYVVNRTVLATTREGILVKNYHMSNPIEVSKKNVFVPDRFSELDKPGVTDE